MDITSWLTDTIYVATVASRNSAGDPTYNTATAVVARVEKVSNLRNTRDGMTKEFTHWIATNTELQLDCRIWFASADTSDVNKARRPMLVRYAKVKSSGQGYYETFI